MGGPFDVPGDQWPGKVAAASGQSDTGGSNADVLKPWINGTGLDPASVAGSGSSILARPCPNSEAALYEAPFQLDQRAHVYPTRQSKPH